MSISPCKNIAIIGCGWLGTPFAHSLIARGFRVIATRSTPENVSRLKSQGIDTIRLALRPETQCEQIERLRGVDIAVVLLAPGIRNGTANEFPERISNLGLAFKSIGINQVILASSISVYPCENRAVDENETSPADSESGRILLEAERRLLNDPDMQTVVIRFAGLCGPGRELGRLLAGKKNIAGACNPVNLIHQADAVEALLGLIEHQPWGRIYNACAPRHPAKRELYPQAARAMGLAIPEFSSLSAPFKKVRGDKICTELGFVYRYPDPADWSWEIT